MAGTGSNSTEEAIMLSKHASDIGANGLLIVTPYYNKPSQEGLYQHFKAINDNVEIPIILYNIPGRSVIDMSDDTIYRLAELPNIAGIKDATGDVSRVSSLRQKLGKDFCQLSGEDATAIAFNAQGGIGCISVTANIMPKQIAHIQNLCADAKYTEALEIHDQLFSLHQTMFCETNPVAVKYAAHLLGHCSDEIRLPLVTPSEANKELVRNTLKQHNLL
jgi:4-hydroxy-tetrahydrodipicolinate synthase